MAEGGSRKGYVCTVIIKARWLYLVGVDPSVRKSDLFKEQPGKRGGEEVVLEKSSRNTLENALYARDLIARQEIRSIRLITSRYHMKRAVLIFTSILPKDIAVYPCPVDSKNLKQAWWAHGGSFRLLFSEFYKYCLFRAFFLFAPGELTVRQGWLSGAMPRPFHRSVGKVPLL